MSKNISYAILTSGILFSVSCFSQTAAVSEQATLGIVDTLQSTQTQIQVLGFSNENDCSADAVPTSTYGENALIEVSKKYDIAKYKSEAIQAAKSKKAPVIEAENFSRAFKLARKSGALFFYFKGNLFSALTETEMRKIKYENSGIETYGNISDNIYQQEPRKVFANLQTSVTVDSGIVFKPGIDPEYAKKQLRSIGVNNFKISDKKYTTFSQSEVRSLVSNDRINYAANKKLRVGDTTIKASDLLQTISYETPHALVVLNTSKNINQRKLFETPFGIWLKERIEYNNRNAMLPTELALPKEKTIVTDSIPNTSMVPEVKRSISTTQVVNVITSPPGVFSTGSITREMWNNYTLAQKTAAFDRFSWSGIGVLSRELAEEFKKPETKNSPRAQEIKKKITHYYGKDALKTIEKSISI